MKGADQEGGKASLTTYKIEDHGAAWGDAARVVDDVDGDLGTSDFVEKV